MVSGPWRSPGWDLGPASWQVRGKFADQRGNFNGASSTGPPWKPPAIGFQAVLEEGHLAAPTVCAPQKERNVTCSKIMIDHVIIH